ncbi:MAG: caspase family protein, partial [Sphingobacteriales bacterium]
MGSPSGMRKAGHRSAGSFLQATRAATTSNNWTPATWCCWTAAITWGKTNTTRCCNCSRVAAPSGLPKWMASFTAPTKCCVPWAMPHPRPSRSWKRSPSAGAAASAGAFPKAMRSLMALPQCLFTQSADRIRVSVRMPSNNNYNGLMAYANGTALFEKPQPLAGKTETVIDVALVDAATNIRVCLVDAQGKETPGDFFYMQGKPAEDRELYVVGIGVSEYRNPQFNLRYAAKDMNDLATFLKSTSSYKKVHVTTWQNSSVTPAIADSIALHLRAARPQDVVLCYFAGHGLLDKAKNYFLATYEQDFNDPARGGLSIDALNRAVSASAARKKLILLDACHSGLVDDLVSAAPMATGDTTGQASVVKRGVKAPGDGGARASELYFSFQHFGQGSGVDILAAAAGNEYALERGDLKNGVFTYSLLQAFSTGKADINDDKSISLSELQRYVAASTAQLTRGAQQPTFRQAN